MLNNNFYDKIKDKLMTVMARQFVSMVVDVLKQHKITNMAEDTNFSGLKTTSVG